MMSTLLWVGAGIGFYVYGDQITGVIENEALEKAARTGIATALISRGVGVSAANMPYVIGGAVGLEYLVDSMRKKREKKEGPADRKPTGDSP